MKNFLFKGLNMLTKPFLLISAFLFPVAKQTSKLEKIQRIHTAASAKVNEQHSDLYDNQFFYPTSNITSPPKCHKHLYWDWENKIDSDWLTPESISEIFKTHREKIKNNDTDFLLGGAISAHQAEGNCDNNTYYLWEKAKKDNPSIPSIQVESGIACDHWNRYKEDIDCAAKAHLNTLRISVEWSKIQPHKPTATNDGFDYEVLQHYLDVCTYAQQKGVKIVITLHHYTDPIWFALEGGFEEQENIHYFAKFCAKVFETLGDKVHLWFTFNSPSGYSSRIYLTNVAPPSSLKNLGKKADKLVKKYKETGNKAWLVQAFKHYKPKSKDMTTATEVLKNVAFAHVEAYKEIKACPGGEKSKVGILKNLHQLEPWSPNNPIDKLTRHVGNTLNDNSLFSFFRTGEFKAYLPIPWFNKWVDESAFHPKAPKSLDFIGLNYYSHRFMHNGKKKIYPGEKMTRNENYTVYPEGLYRAIDTLYKEIAQPLNIPIYITENGIATDDDELRNEFLQKYTFVIAKAIEDGYPINGYIHWSLLDNYEWGMYNKYYGIYHVDRTTLARTLKPGAQHLVDLGQKTFN